MRLGLVGYGKMGKSLQALAPHFGHTIATILSPSLQNLPIQESHTEGVDLFLDFSTPNALLPNLEKLISLGQSVVVGTTGCDLSPFKNQKEVGILYASNFSLGARLFSFLVKKATEVLQKHYKAALHEEHHEQKVDSPSGTAKDLLALLPKNTPHTSLRCGTIIGNHEIIFDSLFDQIRLKHMAKSREVFAAGALRAAEWLQGKKGTFTMEDLLDDLL